MRRLIGQIGGTGKREELGIAAETVAGGKLLTFTGIFVVANVASGATAGRALVYGERVTAAVRSKEETEKTPHKTLPAGYM